MKKTILFLSIFVAVSLACDFSVVVAPTIESPTSAATSPIPVTETPSGDITQTLESATPEAFITLTQAIPGQVQLNGVAFAVQEVRFGGCDIPNCPAAPDRTHYLRVTLQALNLPSDQFPDYKNLPQGIAIHDNTGGSTPFNRLAAYTPAMQQLNLYFAVPQDADTFGLQWPDTAEIPLTVSVNEIPTQQPPSFTGTAITYGVLSLTVPQEVADGASGSEFPRIDSDTAAWWQKSPGHLQVMLGDYYILQGKFHQPQIFVYPAQAYAELVPVAFESLHRLNNILYDPNVTIDPSQLPVIPFFNSRQTFASNIQVISFQNGRGVRFLTEYAQYPASVNNTDLFYHFQGVTNDGAYYVIAVLPITAPTLAEASDGGAVLPPDGIPYPYYADPNADMQAYYAAVTALLNATSPDAFFPTVNQLDALIQSIRIAP